METLLPGSSRLGTMQLFLSEVLLSSPVSWVLEVWLQRLMEPMNHGNIVSLWLSAFLYLPKAHNCLLSSKYFQWTLILATKVIRDKSSSNIFWPCHLNPLSQMWENYGLWTKSSLPPVFFFNKYSFIERQPRLFTYVLSVAAFVLQWQSWVLETEMVWPARPKMFSIRPFTEKVHRPML